MRKETLQRNATQRKAPLIMLAVAVVLVAATIAWAPPQPSDVVYPSHPPMSIAEAQRRYPFGGLYGCGPDLLLAGTILGGLIFRRS